MSKDGLIYGLILDGENKGAEITLGDLQDYAHQSECIWLHFDYTSETTIDWLTNHSQLDSVVVEALLSEETRPRASSIKGGMLVSLRGVNLTPGSNPEDMVAIRVWLDGNRIISTRKRRLLSAQDVVASIKAGEGPTTAGEFIATLSDLMISRMQDTVDQIEESVGNIEEQILSNESYALKGEIANLRRVAISMRRYLAPQRDAMIQLQNEKIGLLQEDDHIRVKETTDHLIRYLEDLDSIRDRAAVAQEEVANRIAEQLNNRMYVLSIVTAVFLPLGFLTGLLGVNIGGMPWVESDYAFSGFSIVLFILVAVQVWYFKKKHWW